MTKKKKEVVIEKVEVGKRYIDPWDTEVEIPEGATHIKFKVDYSNCYYENDTPEYILNFLKNVQS